jgi:heme-degrading monooxygenase HmoA
MEGTYYTHALWRVKPGQEDEFVVAWKAMGDAFVALPGVGSGAQGTLVQSINDATLFYSFGSWQSLEQIQAMRADPTAQTAMSRVRELCIEATPGTYRLVAISGGDEPSV